MNKSFGIRFVLAAMVALAVAVTGCGDDGGDGTAGTGGSGGGTAGTGGSGGGTAGTGGSGGGTAGTGGSGGGTAGTGGSGGTGGEGGTGGGGTPISFATDIQPYFEAGIANCVQCHSDATFAGGGVKLDSYANMEASAGAGPLWVAGDSSMGILIPRLNADHNNGPGDPPNGDAFVITLSEWINDGALDN